MQKSMLNVKSLKSDDEMTNLGDYNWLGMNHPFEFENENGSSCSIFHFE